MASGQYRGLNDNPGGGIDVVAMDDFLFAEPRPVPAPAALLLLVAGPLWAEAAVRSRFRLG